MYSENKIRKLLMSSNLEDIQIAYQLVIDTPEFNKYFRVNSVNNNILYIRESETRFYIHKILIISDSGLTKSLHENSFSKSDSIPG